MTNFDRAIARMQSRGCRPFQPDINHGRAERVLRGRATDEHEPDGLLIDRIMGFVGVAGVVVLAILLLVEQLIGQVAA